VINLMKTGEVNVILLTDASPRLNGGSGCSVLTYRFVHMLGGSLRGLVHFERTSDVDGLIGQENVFTIKASRGMGINRISGRLRQCIDRLVLRAQANRIRKFFSKRPTSSIFAFCGADWRFLNTILYIHQISSVPYDIYVVDDFEESLALADRKIFGEEVKLIERNVLANARYVFAISEGYVRHLKSKYGVDARWLPVIVPDGEWQSNDFGLRPALVGPFRYLVFIGSINHLYISAIREVLGVLRHLNEAGLYVWRLRLVVRDSDYVSNIFKADIDLCEIVKGVSHDIVLSAIRDSDIFLLPYSSESSEKVMVSTSFPTKFTDGVLAGRPILFYGPSYSSIINFAKACDLALVATNIGELRELLEGLTPAMLNSDLIKLRHCVDKLFTGKSVGALLSKIIAE
jgi:glycosyltransferase involved in cell wall biosynthesis